MKLCFLCSLTLVLGMATGFLLTRREAGRRERQPADPSIPAATEARIQPPTPAPRTQEQADAIDLALAQALRENQHLKDELKTLQSRLPPEISAQLDEMRRKMNGLIEARDPAGLEDLARKLGRLGEPAFPLLAELVGVLAKEGMLYKPGYLLDMNGLISQGLPPEFSKWCLLNPSCSSDLVTGYAATGFYFGKFKMTEDEIQGLLKSESHANAAVLLLSILQRERNDGVIPAVIDAARVRNKTPSHVRHILGQIPRSDAGSRFLDALRADSDPVIAEAARIVGLGRRPPVSGMLISDIAEPEKSDFLAGDILISIDDKVLTERSQKDVITSLMVPHAQRVRLYRNCQEIEIIPAKGLRSCQMSWVKP